MGWKRTKLDKDNSEDVTKFRPLSLINTGGKVLEKLFINRINHHVFSHNYVNKTSTDLRRKRARPTGP